MKLPALCIRRPVATTLLTIGVTLAGLLGYAGLPVAPLPAVDFPTITVRAQLPGASAQTVASSVAAPLERHLGRIADVTEMTSQNYAGATRIVLQFGLERDIDGAARDVQAAINAARADLPASLKFNPTYHKVNPAEVPAVVLALTSRSKSPGQIYDAANAVVQQMLARAAGVGDVELAGSALPAVRVELNPHALAQYGIGLEDVRAALAAANANSPKGVLASGGTALQIYDNDQATHAADYRNLVVAWRNGAPVRLDAVASVADAVENPRNAALANGAPTVLAMVYRQPGANIVRAVDAVRAELPQLRRALPADIDVAIVSDRTTTIRAALRDMQAALLCSVGLVMLVVWLFLGNRRAALIPLVALPVSILGTFGVMRLLGYSLDNFSLMALTIATGFVVDDAIVILENISRHIEAGMPRVAAARRGAREVAFTVLSISVSLVVVFLPVLLMPGILGRLFREFAVTLSVAVAISLLISLTTTPMLCAWLLRPGLRAGAGERGLARLRRGYAGALAWCLRHPALPLASLPATIILSLALLLWLPKALLPEQDTGRLIGSIRAEQSISFQAMEQVLHAVSATLRADPAVRDVAGYTGGRQPNAGTVYVSLTPRAQRGMPADAVIARLRGALARLPGVRVYLQPEQDLRTGGRSSAAQYQFSLQADDAGMLYTWVPRLVEALRHDPALADVNSDQQQRGLATRLRLDRATEARLGLLTGTVDETLYDAFGQRQVSTIYAPYNQYHVVMEVAPHYGSRPAALDDIYVSTAGAPAHGTQLTNAVAGTVALPGLIGAATSIGQAGNLQAGNIQAGTALAAVSAAIAADPARNHASNGIASSGRNGASYGAAVATASETMVPLSAFTRRVTRHMPVVVNHTGPFVAETISFNLPAGGSLAAATAAITGTMRRIAMPVAIHGSLAGTALLYQQSLQSEKLLVLAVLMAIYIVLGMLYESYLHPLTILSTLPAAGLGALLALRLCGEQFSIIALIGLLLLIGIVKKNGIMMIDVAIETQRRRHASAPQAIMLASLRRFRPIVMTSCVAMLGALPLALSTADGAELRRPLGIAIIGGLIVSQALTLFTTPVVFMVVDRLRLRLAGVPRGWRRHLPAAAAAQGSRP
jgi:multidrug efflux pump